MFRSSLGSDVRPDYVTADAILVNVSIWKTSNLWRATVITMTKSHHDHGPCVPSSIWALRFEIFNQHSIGQLITVRTFFVCSLSSLQKTKSINPLTLSGPLFSSHSPLTLFSFPPNSAFLPVFLPSSTRWITVITGSVHPPCKCSFRGV